MSRKYVLVTPCRDEAEYARRTLESVVAQSVLPERWVIVDDGSTDETPEILAGYAERFDFIRVVSRKGRERRSVGPGVVEAFYAGLDSIEIDAYDYLCKLDLDLELPPRYFEILMKKMEAEPRLGTCSGKPYYPDPNTGELISEKCGDEMSVGMTKFYRTGCFEEIGGFVPQVMWDGIDCHRARMLGWAACSWDEPDLRFVHLRPMGSSEGGIWTGRTRHGRGQHFMGTIFPYMLASSLYRMSRPPVVLGGAGMLWGYMRSVLTFKPRYEDRRFRSFLRRYQWACLRRGKSAATRDLHEKIVAPPASLAEGSSEEHKLPTVDLRGMSIHALTEADCIDHILQELEAGRGGSVNTPNLDHLSRHRHDAEFRELLARASLVVADGMPLVWASWLQGTPLPERVAGSDLISSLSAGAAKSNRSVYLLGGDPGTAEAAAAVLKNRHPDLRVAGWMCPPFGFEKDVEVSAQLLEDIRTRKPDIVYVALGSPKQERLVHDIAHHLPQAWWLGVGMSFGFLSGRITRAPRWMQRAGLEWMHRLIQEPRRLARRYLVDNLPFAGRLFLGSLAKRFRGRSGAPAASRQLGVRSDGR